MKNMFHHQDTKTPKGSEFGPVTLNFEFCTLNFELPRLSEVVNA